MAKVHDAFRNSLGPEYMRRLYGNRDCSTDRENICRLCTGGVPTYCRVVRSTTYLYLLCTELLKSSTTESTYVVEIKLRGRDPHSTATPLNFEVLQYLGTG